MYKLVLDTNIFLSAFVFNGLLPQKIIDLVVDKKLRLCTSLELKNEVFRKLNVLEAPKEMLAKVRTLFSASATYTPQITIHACRDPKDNYLLELAETAAADYLITRDKDLLDLPKSRWKETKIVKPEDFLPLLRQMNLIEYE